MVKDIMPNLRITPEIRSEYAGKTLFTLNPELQVFCTTIEEVMEWFYKSPEPEPLIYAPDMLVIFACTFAGQDQIEQANQLHFQLLYGELINVEPYQLYTPQGKEGLWTLTDTFPELVQIEII